ncbi:MAG: phosphate regulon transcriptional regulator PhoB [Gammaproteobacteria bacterium]|nr:phosphate regulon transcriptional regulator PhoB [Gammaproteobacteria bacterium]
MGNKVLVIEDEHEIREMLNFSLTRAGFSVCEADSAEAALDQLDGPLPDLLLVAWLLPGMSGVELARRLRQDEHTANLPMIMLTARGEETDKLKSFDSGMDDYLTKPFSPKELIARIRALLRRAGTPENGVIACGSVRLDLNAHKLSVDGQVVQVGPTEFRLLELFMRNPDRAFGRAQLLDRVWGRSIYVEERTVDVHVLRLRKTLKPHGVDQLIQTVRGVGYRFSPA